LATFGIPTSAELKQIEQDLIPRLEADRPIFQYMPMETSEEYLLMWEQEDNFQGLQQIRGLDGAPTRVNMVGAKRYMAQPGVYGEFKLLDEQTILTRRQYGTFGNQIPLTDLVMGAQRHLLGRRVDRIEQILWSILQGTYSVAGPNGAVMATDTYSPQTFSAGVTWATAATATPLADFRAVQLKSRGHSVNFGAGAVAFMNRATVNAILSNTNAADFYGRRVAGLATANSLPDINRLLAMDDLPQIAVYDEGYLSDGTDGNTAGSFQLFIPNNKVIVIGKRPGGVRIGGYRTVPNINNPGFGTGPYTKVIIEDKVVPPKFEVHDGHNGGPVLYFPSAIVIMTV
jgi:hypothetical protein